MFNKTSASDAADYHAAEPSETLGRYLKEARLRQGLELTAIADETRIDIKNLTAIEGDDRNALPADVFTRGFVRLYASHLNLDPQEAIHRYEQQWESDTFRLEAPLERLTPSRSLRPGIFIAVMLIAVLFGVRFFAPTNDERPGNSPAPATSSPAGQGEPAPKSTPGTQPDSQNAQEKSSAADTESEQIPPGTASPPYEIVLTCSEETPITLTLDGTKNTESVCPPKSPQTWRADKAFDLTLGASSGAAPTLTINDVTVPIKAAGAQRITIHRP